MKDNSFQQEDEGGHGVPAGEACRDLLENAPVGIFTATGDGRLRWVNGAMARMYGFDSARQLVTEITDIGRQLCVDSDDYARVSKLLNDQAVVADVEMRQRRRDGGIFWAALSVRALGEPVDGRRGWQGFVRDITAAKESQSALQGAEARFEKMFRNAPMPYQSLDAQGNFLDVNQAFLDALGYSREELIGRNFGDFLLPEDVAHFKYNFPRFKAVGEVLGVEFNMVKKDGSTILVWFNGKIQYDDKGDFQRTHCIFQDITERRRTEAALRESEARHRAMIANIADIIAIADRDGIIRYKSPNIEKWFGWLPADIVGTPAWGNIHPEDLERVLSLYAELLAEPGRTISGESRYRCKDGSYKWMAFTAVNLLHDPDINGFLINYRDISQRKQAELSLRESEARFASAFRSSPAPLVISEIDTGQFIDVNDRWVAMLGYSREEQIGRTSKEVGIWADPADRDRLVRLVHEKGHFRDEPIVFVTKSGQRIFVRWSAEAVTLAGRPVMLSMIYDETEGKKAEAERTELQNQLYQSQKMESVGRLAGGVAHDFNNMLGVILGHTELALERVSSDDPLYADLKEIEQAAGRSANLTRQLLAFARKQTIAPRVLNLNETLEGMLSMLRRLIGEDIDLVWRPGRSLWPVRLDPSQVDQILANLCVNARDAIAGVGKLTIETANAVFDRDYCEQHPDFLPGEYVALAVSDDGCGMDKDVRENLFEPFFTTKKIGQGTGLGLATVYGIVKQNRGFINVYSEPGKGTTFRIYLPRHAAMVTAAETVRKGTPLPGDETILLVEDEPAILKMVARMLEKQGYTVLAAASPGEAMRLAEQHAVGIDLLVTDVVMPGMNGRELARKLMGRHPGLKRLFMSGYTADVVAHRGVLDPGVHFIQKPFSWKDLTHKVRRVLDQE